MVLTTLLRPLLKSVMSECDMATVEQLSEVLQIDGNKKAKFSAEISGQCSKEVAHGFLPWNASEIIRITKRPALVEHSMGALTSILTSHLKDVISHSQASDAYSTTREE